MRRDRIDTHALNTDAQRRRLIAMLATCGLGARTLITARARQGLARRTLITACARQGLARRTLITARASRRGWEAAWDEGAG
jgi:hypothetical protein